MKKLKVTSLVKKHLKALRTELIASQGLFPKNDLQRGFNLGLNKAVDFVDSYIKGSALMQYLPKKSNDK